jgi:pimeloyl-ACP methyl ester carboxylesterase
MNRNTLRRLALPLATLASAAVVATSPAGAAAPKPTVILVHGAFADSASWNGVIAQLQGKGYPVVAAANPLRTVAGDAAYVGSVIDRVKGPVVLVGHSYGGVVITNAAVGRAQVKALVYVAAFAPEAGESALDLAGKFPGGTLGEALDAPAALPEGGVELSIQQDKFWQQFAADVSESQARLMAAGQRPIAEAALKDPTKVVAWKQLPSYFVYGTADKNIPARALGYMAERAASRKTVVVDGASHVVMTSRPETVVALIEEAAAGR